MNSLIDVLKSPSVWTGKDGVTAVTDLLKNPPLQDKIQFGLMKSSFDTLVKTGEIVTPGTDLKKPTGQLYNAAANAGKNLISASAGVVAAPKALSSLASDSLSNLSGSLSRGLGSAVGSAVGAIGGVTGAISGAVGSAVGAIGGVTGALDSITSRLPSASSLANRGTAELGGLLANASKFGVGNAVAWAKGTTSATDAISGAAGSLASGVSGAISGISDAASKLTSGLKTQMDSLAKQGQFAVNFSDFKLPASVAGIIPAAGFKGTIDRSTLNAATAKLIGSDKIPLPNFSPQLINTSALTDAANKAKGLLSGGLDAKGLLSNATGTILGTLTGQGSLTTANIDGKINALGDPNAPPYTGDDPIIRARLGLPPVRVA